MTSWRPLPFSLDMGPLPHELRRKSHGESARRDVSGQRAGAATAHRRDLQLIRNCARAGIMQVKYNFTLSGSAQRQPAKGTRPLRYSEFVLRAREAGSALTNAGKVDSRHVLGEAHSRTSRRVVPVAEE